MGWTVSTTPTADDNDGSFAYGDIEGAQQYDVVVAHCQRLFGSAFGTPTGWQVALADTNSSAIFYKVQGATPDTQIAVPTTAVNTAVETRVIRGLDVSTATSCFDQCLFTNSSANDPQSPAVTPANPLSTILYAFMDGSSINGMPDYGLKNGGGEVWSYSSVFVAEGFAETTALKPAMTWRRNTTNLTAPVMCVTTVWNDSGAGEIKAWADDANRPATFVHCMAHSGYASGATLVNTYDPTTEIPNIANGLGGTESVVYKALGFAEDVLQVGSYSPMLQSSSGADADKVVIAGSQLTSIPTMTGKHLCFTPRFQYAIQPYAYNRVGFIFGLSDRTNTRLWHFGARDTSPNATEGLYPVVIDPDGGFEWEDKGTVVLSSMDSVVLGHHVPGAFHIMYSSPVVLLETLIIKHIAGSNYPASMLDAEEIAKLNRLNTVQRQGGQSRTQFIIFQDIEIQAMDWDGSTQSEAMPGAYDEAGRYVQAMIPSASVSRLVNIPDGATYVDKNKVIDGGNYNLVGFKDTTSTHATTTYAVSGLTWINCTPYLNEINGALAGLLVADSKKAVFTVLADCTGGVTFSGCVDSEAIEVASSADFNKLHNCDFLDNSDAAIKLSGNHAAITANGMTFSGNATKMHYTGTTPLTITADANTNLVAGSYPAGTDNSEVRCPNAQVIIAAPTKGITFTGTITGAQIVVYEAGLQGLVANELDRFNSSTGSDQWETSVDDTVDYTILHPDYGYVRITNVSVTQALTVNIDSLLIKDRAYQSGTVFTYGALNDGGYFSGQFEVETPITGQRFYSAMKDAWKNNDTGANQELRNVDFPIANNGTGSFIFSEPVNKTKFKQYIYDDSIIVQNSSGALLSVLAAVVNQGNNTGYTAEIQQVAGAAPIKGWNAPNQTATGNVNMLIEVYRDDNGDGTPDFDYRNYMVVEYAPAGEYQDRVIVHDIYPDGFTGDEKYVIAVEPIAANVTAADPLLASPPTITRHVTPEVWTGHGGGSYSCTITDSVAGNTGAQLEQYINWFAREANDTTFQGDDPVNYYQMIQANGDKYKTVRGIHLGFKSNALIGVRVVQSDGVTPHADFNLFVDDSGAEYVPPVQVTIRGPNLIDGTFVVIEDNDNPGTYIDDGTVVAGGNGYSKSITYTSDLNLRFLAAYCEDNAVTPDAKELIDEIVPLTTGGATMPKTQTDHTIYNGYAFNGFDQIGWAADYVNDADGLNVDISFAGSTFDIRRGFAWYISNLMTENGLKIFAGIIRAVSAGHLEFDFTKATVRLDNIGSQNMLETSNVLLTCSDGSDPRRNPPTGGFGISMNVGDIYVAHVSSASVVTAQDKTDIAAEVAAHTTITNILADTNELQTNQGNWLTATGFATTEPDNASIAAVKAKTDQLTFTNPNQVDANAQSINDGEVVGEGTEADPWRKAGVQP